MEDFIKIGLLIDTPEYTDALQKAARLAFDAAEKELVRSIELIVAADWHTLAEQGVVAIIGPVLTENAPELLPYIESTGHIPTITLAGGTEALVGHWCFDCGFGNVHEEPYLLTNYMIHHDMKKALVIHEHTLAGNAYFNAFRNAAKRDGISMAAVEEVRVRQDLAAAAKRLKQIKADALVYLGHHANGICALEWEIPVLATIQKQPLPDVISVRVYDEENPAAKKIMGSCGDLEIALAMYDAAHLTAKALCAAETLTPMGIRDGFEKVKWLPSASGAAGTMVNLGKYRHCARYGTGSLMLQQNNKQVWQFRGKAEPFHPKKQKQFSTDYPIRVGWLCDYPILQKMQRQLLQYAFDNAYDNAILPRPVKIIGQKSFGLPFGHAASVVKSWKKLARKDCVFIFGPYKAENAEALFPYVEQVGHIPTMTVAGGTDEFMGNWCFDCGNGALGEEPYLLVNYLEHHNLRNVGLIVEQNVAGKGYWDGFRQAAKRGGIHTVALEMISPIEKDLLPVAERLRASDCDAVVYLGDGGGGALVAFNKTLAKMNWDPIRLTTTALLTACAQMGGLATLKGFIGVDQYDEENPITKEFLDGFEQRYGYRPANGIAMFFHDAARVIAQGIGMADNLSPQSIRDGMERVKWLPAVSGSKGSALNLGKYRHCAWYGKNYLVLRKVVEGRTHIADIKRELPSILVHRYYT